MAFYEPYWYGQRSNLDMTSGWIENEKALIVSGLREDPNKITPWMKEFPAGPSELDGLAKRDQETFKAQLTQLIQKGTRWRLRDQSLMDFPGVGFSLWAKYCDSPRTRDCPLTQLPPELRIMIVAYTDMTNSVPNKMDACKPPLMALARTCRLFRYDHGPQMMRPLLHSFRRSIRFYHGKDFPENRNQHRQISYLPTTGHGEDYQERLLGLATAAAAVGFPGWRGIAPAIEVDMQWLKAAEADRPSRETVMRHTRHIRTYATMVYRGYEVVLVYGNGATRERDGGPNHLAPNMDALEYRNNLWSSAWFIMTKAQSLAQYCQAERKSEKDFYFAVTELLCWLPRMVLVYDSSLHKHSAEILEHHRDEAIAGRRAFA